MLCKQPMDKHEEESSGASSHQRVFIEWAEWFQASCFLVDSPWITAVNTHLKSQIQLGICFSLCISFRYGVFRLQLRPGSALLHNPSLVQLIGWCWEDVQDFFGWQGWWLKIHESLVQPVLIQAVDLHGKHNDYVGTRTTCLYLPVLCSIVLRVMWTTYLVNLTLIED